MEQTFDLVVVGLGPVGSATVRHAAGEGARVAGIGVEEPSDWQNHRGPFASHYDSGRITRLLDGSPIWAELARRSIDEYPAIARRSGVEFHHPVGVLWSAAPGGLEHLLPAATQHGVDVSITRAAERPLSLLSLEPANDTLIEPGPAGHIDPREMVRAQKRIALDGGAQLFDEEVVAVSAGPVAEVRTEERTVRGRTVVVAAGGYTASLLAGVPIVPTTEAVVLGEVSADTAAGLVDVPCVIHETEPGGHVDVYLIPPVRYPDGRWYIKLGAETPLDHPLSGPADIKAWMAGAGAESRRELLVGLITAMVPDVDFLRFVVKPCIYARTPSRLPYVDHLSPGVVVAAGGNGRAAKSSDALGSLAARLALLGEWDDPLPSTAFELPL